MDLFEYSLFGAPAGSCSRSSRRSGSEAAGRSWWLPWGADGGFLGRGACSSARKGVDQRFGHPADVIDETIAQNDNDCVLLG